MDTSAVSIMLFFLFSVIFFYYDLLLKMVRIPVKHRAGRGNIPGNLLRK